MKQILSLTKFPMKRSKVRGVIKLSLLSPSEAARVSRNAQAETFAGHQLVGYGEAKELIVYTISRPCLFKPI